MSALNTVAMHPTAAETFHYGAMYLNDNPITAACMSKNKCTITINISSTKSKD